MKHIATILEYPSQTRDERKAHTWAYCNGLTRPHYPVPTVMGGAYVIATAIAADGSLLVAWFADGDTIAI